MTHVPAPLLAEGTRVREVRDAVLTEQSFRRAVAVSVLAPSLHNSQPWSFEQQGDRVLVRVDPGRWLRHEDPLHREQVLSCGAALHHLVLGLRHQGLDATWELGPPDSRELVAVVTVVGHRPETWHELHLYGAASGRHMDRSAFSAEPVPAVLLEHLATLVAEQHCSLQRLDRRGIEALATLTSLADTRLQEDPWLRAEQERWTSDSRRPVEGVPRDALPVDPPVSAPVPLRDFSGSQVPRPVAPADDLAVIVVLASDQDDRKAWVRCGWALSELLLSLADVGLVASPVNQSLEITGLRACLRAACQVNGSPQMVLRIGYPSTFGSPRAGRRPVDDVVRRSP